MRNTDERRAADKHRIPINFDRSFFCVVDIFSSPPSHLLKQKALICIPHIFQSLSFVIERMAESTSPTLIRSSDKLLEYTSCIDTAMSLATPISTCGDINAHSSFDSISQARDCDALANQHGINHRILERDLRRIDVDTNKRVIHIQNKKLDRTESISLPATPTEHLSSKFHHSMLLGQPATTHSDDDDDDDLDDDGDDDDDDARDDDGRQYHRTSSTDYMTAVTDPILDESQPDSKR